MWIVFGRQGTKVPHMPAIYICSEWCSQSIGSTKHAYRNNNVSLSYSIQDQAPLDITPPNTRYLPGKRGRDVCPSPSQPLRLFLYAARTTTTSAFRKRLFTYHCSLPASVRSSTLTVASCFTAALPPPASPSHTTRAPRLTVPLLTTTNDHVTLRRRLQAVGRRLGLR